MSTARSPSSVRRGGSRPQGAPDRRAGGDDDVHDGVIKVAGAGGCGGGGGSGTHGGCGRCGRSHSGVARVAAGHRRIRLRAVPEVSEQRQAAAARLLDVPPDRAVLVPSDALGLARGGDADPQQMPVPFAGDPAGCSVGRGGAWRYDPSAREVADHRAHRLDVGSAPAAGIDEPGKLRERDVVAAVSPRPSQPLGDPLEARRRRPGSAR